MVRNSHKKLGITPKAPLARGLQSLVYRLPSVQSEADKQAWQRAYDNYLASFLVADRQNVKLTGAFRAMHTLLANGYGRNELFTFLRYPGLSNNTNAIESQNHTLRESLQRHRGMPLAQREALISWLLLFKSTDDLTVIRRQYEAQKEDENRHTF